MHRMYFSHFKHSPWHRVEWLNYADSAVIPFNGQSAVRDLLFAVYSGMFEYSRRAAQFSRNITRLQHFDECRDVFKVFTSNLPNNKFVSFYKIM